MSADIVDIEQAAEAAWTEAKPVRPRLKPYALHELDQLPRRDYLVKHLLDKGGVSVLFGESNCGKSFFALDLSLHVAAGGSWRGRRVKQAAVCYIAAEGGLGIVERLTAFRYHHDIDAWDTPLHLIADRPDFCMSEGDALTVLRHLKDAGIKPGLIVIDTLAASFGGGNENNPDDMNRFINNAAKLRDCGTHVLIVHHSGKDAAKGARGHSSLRAATDTEIEIVADQEGHRTATVVKQRDGAKDDEFHFTLEPVDLGIDEDEDRVTSCVVLPADTGPGRKRGKRASLSPKLTKALAVLTNCMVTHGKTAPGTDSYPPGVMVVHTDVWRDQLAKRGVLSSDNPATAGRQWRRIRETLFDKDRIAEYENLIWIVKDRTAVRTDKRTSL